MNLLCLDCVLSNNYVLPTLRKTTHLKNKRHDLPACLGRQKTPHIRCHAFLEYGQTGLRRVDHTSTTATKRVVNVFFLTAQLLLNVFNGVRIHQKHLGQAGAVAVSGIGLNTLHALAQCPGSEQSRLK